MNMIGELKFFSGLQIIQKDDEIFIHQQKYTKGILKRFRMHKSKPMTTPMHPFSVIDKDVKGNDTFEKEYIGMIGFLLYLIASRLDNVFVVCHFSRFQSCPKVSHVIVVQRILRYFVGTTNHDIWFEKGFEFDLVGYCDTDITGDKVERKSTNGACQFLVKSLV